MYYSSATLQLLLCAPKVTFCAVVTLVLAPPCKSLLLGIEEQASKQSWELSKGKLFKIGESLCHTFSLFLSLRPYSISACFCCPSQWMEQNSEALPNSEWDNLMKWHSCLLSLTVRLEEDLSPPQVIDPRSQVRRLTQFQCLELERQEVPREKWQKTWDHMRVCVSLGTWPIITSNCQKAYTYPILVFRVRDTKSPKGNNINKKLRIIWLLLSLGTWPIITSNCCTVNDILYYE